MKRKISLCFIALLLFTSACSASDKRYGSENTGYIRLENLDGEWTSMTSPDNKVVNLIHSDQPIGVEVIDYTDSPATNALELELVIREAHAQFKANNAGMDTSPFDYEFSDYYQLVDYDVPVFQFNFRNIQSYVILSVLLYDGKVYGIVTKTTQGVTNQMLAHKIHADAINSFESGES